MSNKPTKHLRIILALAALLGAAEASVDLKPHIKSLKSFSVLSASPSTMPQILRLNFELLKVLNKQAKDFDTLTPEEHRDLYQVAQLSKAYFESLKAVAYLQTKVSSLVDIESLRLRIPNVVYGEKVAEIVKRATRRYGSLGEYEKDLSIIKGLNDEIISPTRALLEPKISEAEFISRTKGFVAVQNLFLIHAFAERYASRGDVSHMKELKQELSVCFRNNYVNERAGAMFATYKKNQPNGDLISTYRTDETLIQRIQELQASAKDFATRPSGEKYAEYVKVYGQLFLDPKLTLITSTPIFLSWLGPVKSGEQLKRDIYHLNPSNEFERMKTASNVKELLASREAKDVLSVTTLIERIHWKASMKEACEAVTRATTVKDLLDWPIAVGLMLKRDLGLTKYLPEPMNVRYDEIQKRERNRKMLAIGMYSTMALMVASGIGSYYVAPELMMVVHASTVLLTVASVGEILMTRHVWNTLRNEDARVNAAMISQFGDEAIRKRSFELYDQIYVLTTTMVVAGVLTAAFDAHALLKPIIKKAIAAKGSVLLTLKRTKGQLEEALHAETVLGEEVVLKDIVEETPKADEIVETVAKTESIVATLAAPVLRQSAKPRTFEEWYDLMNPKNVLGNLYKETRLTISSSNLIEEIATLNENLSFPGRTEIQTYGKRGNAGILERLGLVEKAETEGAYVGLSYRELTLPDDAVILEIGPGRNPIAPDLAKSTGAQHYMVDPMPAKELISAAEEEAMAELAKDGHLVFGIAQDLPLQDEAVDLFVSHGTFYHFVDMRNQEMGRALEEAFRVLKKGGQARIHVGMQQGDNYAKQIEMFLEKYAKPFKRGVTKHPPRIQYAWEGDCLWFKRLP